ncbi:MAG TPA: MarR family winged helix-turn-helix transcriptional regulator [Actinomycetes bacterium]|jgi:DNA-binding MarR family transcriptional regulator|nr:MarR family winged helix-turn-helix transcriptional regulator [Actinomycetes bacterium]
MSTIPKRQHAVESVPEPPPWTPAGDAFTRLLMRVVRLVHDFTAAGEALARPAGQTLARWLVLEEVQREPATVAEIARRLGLARQSVQRVADVLERDGDAAYQENPAHRRAKLLRITPAGLAALRAIQTTQRAWSDALGREVGEAELRAAGAVLDQVLVALRGRTADEFTKGAG